LYQLLNNFEINKIKINELLNSEMHKKTITYLENTNDYGIIYSSNGLIKKLDIFNVKYIEIIFENKFKLLNEILYKLKNLGDVGMAYYASLNGYHFKTTDNIAKTYFTIFNFYKFIKINNIIPNFEYTVPKQKIHKKFGYLIA